LLEKHKIGDFSIFFEEASIQKYKGSALLRRVRLSSQGWGLAQRVQRSSDRVQRSSDGSALHCCKAGPRFTSRAGTEWRALFTERQHPNQFKTTFCPPAIMECRLCLSSLYWNPLCGPWWNSKGMSKEYIISHCSEETIWPDYSMVTDLLYEVILLNW
jgi:hypothetical protein